MQISLNLSRPGKTGRSVENFNQAYSDLSPRHSNEVCRLGQYDPCMGDAGPADYDSAMTGEPTELAPSADETAAHTAWALDDGPEWKPPFWTPGRITAVVVSSAVVAAIVVAGFAGYHLHGEPPAPAASTPTPIAPPAAPPPPPVAVEPVDYPQQLLTRLRALGWSVWNPADMARDADKTCGRFLDGLSADGIAQELVDQHGLSWKDASDFVGAVSDVYPDCP